MSHRVSFALPSLFRLSCHTDIERNEEADDRDDDDVPKQRCKWQFVSEGLDPKT